MRQGLPTLQEARAELDRIAPPAGLADLHDDIGKLLELRTRAYRTAVEATDSPAQDWHGPVEADLDSANALIVRLNAQLQQIDAAASQALQQQMASP